MKLPPPPPAGGGEGGSGLGGGERGGGDGGGGEGGGAGSDPNSPPQYVTKLREFEPLSQLLLLAATVREEPEHDGHDTQLEHVLPPA